MVPFASFWTRSKGRDEDALAHSMAWVRHHDKYNEGYFVDPMQLYPQPEKKSK